jgi:hypothetical protein
MKKTTLLALAFSVMFSSPSYAEWTKTIKSVSGNTFYVDFETIRKHDGFLYSWELIDRPKQSEYGDWSAKIYKQNDCKLFRTKVLHFIHHKLPMGQDNGEASSIKSPEWEFVSPSSVNGKILKAVCNR